MGAIFPFLFKLPLTYAERLATGDEEIRIPATLEEYLEFAEQCEYKVEYSNGKIVAMSQPTDTHEQICANIAWAFNNLISDDDPYVMYGSNLGIYMQETGAHYKPDASVLNERPQFIWHMVGKRRVRSVLNPLAVLEVSSDGTVKYDFDEKLPNFQQCPTARYIIFINQHQPFVTLWTRSDASQPWLKSEHSGLDASFTFEGWEVKLRSLYRKVIFFGSSPAKPNGKQ